MQQRLARFVGLTTISALLVIPAGAQDTRTAVQTVLAHLAPNQQLPLDLIITGQLTDPSGAVLPFRITTKGKDQALYETGTGPTLVTTTISKATGWNTFAGKVTPLQTYSAMQRPTIMPFLDLLAEAATPTLQISDKGAVTLGTATTHLYTLKLPDPTPNQRIIGRPFDEQADFYVDPVSLLIVRSVRLRMAENSMNVRVQLTTDFSDYRNVQGFALPFRIVETASFETRKPAQSVYVIQNVTVNSGVPDSTFVAPGAKK